MNLINLIKEEYNTILKEEDYKGEHEAPSREYGSPLHDVRVMFGNDFYDLSSKEIARQFGSYNSYDERLASIIKSYKNKPNAKVKIYRAIPDFNKEITDKIKNLSSIINYYNNYNFYPSAYKYKKLNEIVSEYENIIKNNNPDIDYDKLQKEIYDNISKDINELSSKKEKYKINSGDWVTIIKDYAIQHGKNVLNKYIILSKTVNASEIYTEGYLEEWGYDPISNNLNEDNNNNQKEQDIQSLVDIIDNNPNSPKIDMYKNTLKDKYNYTYVEPEIRFKKDIEIVNKESNKKYTTVTDKNLKISFITKSKKDLPRTIGITIYNENNERIGGAGFNINSFEKSIIIGGVIVYEEYRRKGIYTKIVDYIEKIANKYNLKIIEGSRSKDAREFWQNRLNK
jgi:GNAT superfamily N-acetyltransferase